MALKDLTEEELIDNIESFERAKWQYTVELRKREHGRRAGMGAEEAARLLDKHGVTLIKFRDPVDGSEVAALDWRQASVLAEKLERIAELCDGTDTETHEATQAWLVDNIRAVLS